MTSGTSYSPPPAFGRFKLLHQIGAGVLGPVFRTHDPDHDRLVAVKAFTLDLTPEQAAALAVEFARLAALGLDAPYLAAPIGAGVEELVPYVAVPHVSGESLDAAIRQYGPAPAGDAMRLITHVAEALDAASHAGVYHGSLHPRDIIVTPGETHVTGLGVAQSLERVGLHGPVRRPYVAPEREGGDEWGAAADIYALAAIAYEVLTGRRALPGTDQPLPGLSDLHVHDAAALRDVLEAALDTDPDRRPARARDFAMGFAAALAESAGGGAAGERPPDRRARRPRTRPPKLPGLDDPLAAAEQAGRSRPKVVEAVVPAPVPVEPVSVSASPLAAVPEEAAVVSPPPADALSGEIRYVPVSDPADAGESAPDVSALSAALSEVRLEPEPPRDLELPAAIDLPADRLATGFTPDLRLADELLSRPGGAGETVDDDLTAALDRLAASDSAAPTPAAIGLDILGPGPSEKTAVEEAAAATIDFDLAADAQVRYPVPDASAPAGQPAGDGDEVRVPADDFSLDFNDAIVTPAEPAGRPDSEPDLGAVDLSLPPPEPVGPAPTLVPAPAAGVEGTPPAGEEPQRPFVRGRDGERRRPPSRYSRIEPTPPEARVPAEGDAGVPRAFDAVRPTPPARPAPDFELLTHPVADRPPFFPVLIGVVAGLIVGLAGGYWLGSRAETPVASAPARAVTTVPPSAAQMPARSEPAPAAAVPPPARPEPAPSAAPSTSRTSPPGTAAARGSIQVSASQQANVYLDGERKGLTPRGLGNVPLGSHTIRVTRPGYAPQEQTVVLTAEEPSAALSFTLRRGSGTPSAGSAQAPAVRSVLTVFIDSNPQGARIRIDGRDLAPTPLTVRQLRPGTHTIELRLPGYRSWSQKLTVAAGDNRRITATLERDTTR